MHEIFAARNRRFISDNSTQFYACARESSSVVTLSSLGIVGEGEGRDSEGDRLEERRFGITFPYFGEGIKIPIPSESKEEPIGKNAEVDP